MKWHHLSSYGILLMILNEWCTLIFKGSTSNMLISALVGFVS
jgi:hypothetical protein